MGGVVEVILQPSLSFLYVLEFIKVTILTKYIWIVTPLINYEQCISNKIIHAIMTWTVTNFCYFWTMDYFHDNSFTCSMLILNTIIWFTTHDIISLRWFAIIIFIVIEWLIGLCEFYYCKYMLWFFIEYTY
jgi:hypothetical protein